MIRKVCFFGLKTESVLKTENRSGPAKNRFSVALVKLYHKFIIAMIFPLISKPEASNRNTLYKYSSNRHIKLLFLILIDLVDIWYDDKYLYKVVMSTIQTCP